MVCIAFVLPVSSHVSGHVLWMAGHRPGKEACRCYVPGAACVRQRQWPGEYFSLSRNSHAFRERYLENPFVLRLIVKLDLYIIGPELAPHVGSITFPLRF